MITVQSSVPANFSEKQASILRKLGNTVEHEQRATGYPKQRKHMVYSDVVKQLVIAAFNSGVRQEDIAAQGKISTTSVSAWCAESSHQFRELLIIPEEPEINNSKNHHTHAGECSVRAIKLLFPSGIIMQVVREDLDEDFLKMLTRCGG